MWRSVPQGTRSTSFVYNGDGSCVQSTINGVSTYFVGNYYELNGGTVTKCYYTGANRVAMNADGTVYYLLSDQLGSTSVTTDASGVTVSELRYKAWGEARYTSGMTPTHYTYSGQYSDSYINLLDYGSRRYDPELGRFIQPDSIVPDSSNPQAHDRYSYTFNNPIRYTDPSGHKPCWATSTYSRNLSHSEISRLQRGSRSEQNFIAGLLGYSDWEVTMIESLRKAGAQGLHAAEYIVEHHVHIEFKDLLWGGGGWGLDRNITLQEAYKARGPKDAFMVGLFAH